MVGTTWSPRLPLGSHQGPSLLNTGFQGLSPRALSTGISQVLMGDVGDGNSSLSATACMSTRSWPRVCQVTTAARTHAQICPCPEPASECCHVNPTEKEGSRQNPRETAPRTTPPSGEPTGSVGFAPPGRHTSKPRQQPSQAGRREVLEMHPFHSSADSHARPNGWMDQTGQEFKAKRKKN